MKYFSIFLLLSFIFFLANGNLLMGDKMTKMTTYEKIQMSAGDEKHSISGKDFYAPPIDSILLVIDNVDYGGSFSGPTSYTPQRHTCYIPGEDTYCVVWEWGPSQNQSVSFSKWMEIAGYGFWTQYEHMNDSGIDSGRPSVDALSDGTVVCAWHEAFYEAGQWDIWFGKYENDIWTSAAIEDTTDDLVTTFPCLTVDLNDNIWIVYQTDLNGLGSDNTDIIVKMSSDRGNTWNKMVINENDPVNTWMMPVIAADPANGDIWVSYGDTATINSVNDENLDIIVQKYDSQLKSWLPRQAVAEGAYGAQCALPTMVVDSKHNVHIVYQLNGMETGNTGSLQGYSFVGPAGIMKYINNVEGDWSNPAVVQNGTITDSITGPPSLGRDVRDGIWLAFSQIDSSDGTYLFNTFDTYITKKEPFSDEFGDRINLSKLGSITPDSGHTIYPHITQKINLTGPGVCWSFLKNATVPASVYYNHFTENKINNEFEAKEIEGSKILLSWKNLLEKYVSFNVLRSETIDAKYEKINAGLISICEFIDSSVSIGKLYWYKLECINEKGETRLTEPISISLSGLNFGEKAFKLLQNSPNPFNPETNIKFELDRTSHLTLKIYSASGELVKILVDKTLYPGQYSAKWDGSNQAGIDVSSGIYFYVLESLSGKIVNKMVLMK